MLALCLGSLTYGYDFSIISTTLGQPNFFAYFGLTALPNNADLYAYTNQIIGAISGRFSASRVFGSLGMAWMCNKHGQKAALTISSVIGLVGGALQAGSVHIAMYLIAQFITGIAVGKYLRKPRFVPRFVPFLQIRSLTAIGILVTLVPLFQAEIAPPANRGFLVAQHGEVALIYNSKYLVTKSTSGVVIVAGYSIAGWVGFTCYYASNAQFQWHFPLSLQAPWPLLMLCFIKWVPESPYWRKLYMVKHLH